MDEQSVSMNSTEFDDFMRTLSVLKEICNDVDIQGGFVRQRTNDNTSIFEIDLSSILPDISIALPDLKQKVDLLKLFTGEDVTVNVNDDTFSFSDQYSTLSFKKPDADFIDNRFIPENELESMFVLNPDDIILSTDITIGISERCKIITTGFHVDTIQLIFNGETASLSTTSQSKDQHANIISGLTPDTVMNASSNLVITPFVIDHDNDIKFEMYPLNNEVCVNKYSTSISDFDITIYSRSTLVHEETGE